MTEIDFIPQWYKADRKRRQWYQRQYLMLVLAAGLLCLWCLAAGHSAARATAAVNEVQADFEKGIRTYKQFRQLEDRCTQLKIKSNLLDMIVPHSRYSAALAELACCIVPDVVVSKVTIQRTAPEKNSEAGKGKTTVSVAAKSDSKNALAPLAFGGISQIDLSGIALSAQEVAGLIEALEQSAYFGNVTPIFSKNKQIGNKMVTEFEIRFCVMDFGGSERQSQ